VRMCAICMYDSSSILHSPELKVVHAEVRFSPVRSYEWLVMRLHGLALALSKEDDVLDHDASITHARSHQMLVSHV